MSYIITPDMEKQNTYYEWIGSQIYKLRSKNKLTQQDFGELFGISRVAVTNIESGKQRLSIYHYACICNRFNISLNDFSSNIIKGAYDTAIVEFVESDLTQITTLEKSHILLSPADAVELAYTILNHYKL